METQASNIRDLFLFDPIQHPDPVRLTHAISPAFVISRYPNGEILSRYGDVCWDLTPYRVGNSGGKIRIYFDRYPNKYVEEAKKFLIRILYFGTTPKSQQPSVFTVRRMNKSLVQLAHYSDKRQLSIFEIISDKQNFIRFLRSEMTEGDTRNLSSLIQTLYRIDEPAWVISGLNLEIVNLAKLKAKQCEPTEQNPVIPQSILSNLIKGIEGLVEELDRNSKGLLALLRNMASDYNYGRCHGVQRKYGLKSSNFKPTFHEAVKLHRLVRLCRKYDITSVNNLSKFLRQFMHAVRVQIGVFSGMRHTEIIGLKVGCLKKKKAPLRFYEIHGSHYKTLGQPQADFWYTDGSVAPGIKLCEKISMIVNQVLKFDWEVPLFLLPRFLLRTINLPTRPMDVEMGNRNNHYDQCISLIGTQGLEIQAAHIEELYKIDPFKDWRNDPKYQIGKLWPFRFNQFRRSLALYARQSGLVSLPTLKRQLKHASKALTLYYGSAKGLSSSERHAEHFVHFMKRMEPEADLIAFFNNLVMSKERTLGVAGKSIKQIDSSDHTILLEQRAFYEKKFRKGLMSYSEIPLGACLNPGPCSKIVGSLTACISCKDAAIKESNLDIVLKRQQRFVTECQRNGFDDFEYRHETQELEVLTKFKKSISKR